VKGNDVRPESQLGAKTKISEDNESHRREFRDSPRLVSMKTRKQEEAASLVKSYERRQVNGQCVGGT